jgi:hypothetical protein
MVSVVVLAVDLKGHPIANADVLAYCEPWDFTQRGKTGEEGRWTAKGPKGVWTFYAATEYRSSDGVVAALRRVRIECSTSVTVKPDRRMNFKLTSPMPSDMHVYLTPTDLPSPVECIHCGVVKPNAKTEWAVSSGITGIATALQHPEVGRPGRLQFFPFGTGQPPQIPGNAGPVGRVRFSLDSNLAGNSWWNFWFDPLDHEAGIQWPIAPRVSPGRSTYEIDVTPGNYRIWTDFYQVAADGALQLGAAFTPRVVTVKANQSLDFSYSTQLRVKSVEVLAWNWMVHLWFDLVDRNGNYVDYLSGKATLKVQQNGTVAYDGPVESSSSRYIGLQKPLSEMRTSKPIEVQYSYDSPVVGKMTYTGRLPQDRPFNEQLPVIAETEHFTLRSRDSTPYGHEIVGSLEKAYSWLDKNYAGPVHPSTLPRFGVGFWSYVGMAGSSGDLFGTDVYSAGKLIPNTCPEHSMGLFHEFGHSYQGSPPHHQAKGMGSSAGESQANLIAAYLFRALQGDRVFRQFRQSWSKQFFQFLLAGKEGDIPNFNRQIFILLYIDARYGFHINRDFFRAIYADEGNCAQLLASMDFLTNDDERIAAMYSFLVGENLAWLYRWARLPVADASIDEALSRFRQLKAAVPPPWPRTR